MVMFHVKNVLRKYAQFSGTSSRAEFWNFFGFFWSVMIGVSLLEGVIETDFLFPIAYFGLLLPYFACAVRRVRDASGNGWFVLIPVYNFILLLSKSKTKEGPNS
jgi:uncharacterized membrane protein YhaH (DUF805 family)